MSFLKGAVGIVMGIVIMLFGGLMLYVAGYGVMKPVYSGIVWLGVAVFIGSPLVYWGGGLVRRVRRNS